MRALLLAAGKATRLGELSLSTPKCLLQVGGEKLIDRLIRQLREVGVDDFLVNTHHLAPLIREHIATRPDRDQFVVTFEEELLGTLGTLRENVDFFQGEPGWVLHADNFISGSLLNLLDRFSSRPPLAVGAMLTFEALDPSSCGVVITDELGVVTAFYEKVPDPPGNEASAATFVFDAGAIQMVGEMTGAGLDISRDLIPQFLGRIVTAHHDGYVVDIGTPDGLARAEILARRCPAVPETC